MNWLMAESGNTIRSCHFLHSIETNREQRLGNRDRPHCKICPECLLSTSTVPHWAQHLIISCLDSPNSLLNCSCFRFAPFPSIFYPEAKVILKCKPDHVLSLSKNSAQASLLYMHQVSHTMWLAVRSPRQPLACLSRPPLTIQLPCPSF